MQTWSKKVKHNLSNLYLFQYFLKVGAQFTKIKKNWFQKLLRFQINYEKATVLGVQTFVRRNFRVVENSRNLWHLLSQIWGKNIEIKSRKFLLAKVCTPKVNYLFHKIIRIISSIYLKFVFVLFDFLQNGHRFKPDAVVLVKSDSCLLTFQAKLDGTRIILFLKLVIETMNNTRIRLEQGQTEQ